MSSVVVLTPIVIGSWPAISAAVLGAASALGFATAGGGIDGRGGALRESVETEVPNSEVLAEGLARGQHLQFSREGVDLKIGVDDRGRCTVSATGRSHGKSELRRIGEQVAGRIVQQFAYHRLVTELKSRGFGVVDEKVEADHSIHMRVRLNR